MKKKSNFVAEIDAKFADIQKFINEYPDLSEETKENMIAWCIECNDTVVKMYNLKKGTK